MRLGVSTIVIRESEMTTQDYTRIAAVIRPRVNMATTGLEGYEKSYITGYRNATQDLVMELAVAMKIDNERFDRSTFFVACGLDGAGAYHR
jgi:hypothetical protein